MAKAEPIKLSNSEIAARLLGFHARYFEEITFKPGDVIKSSAGIRPSAQEHPDALARFAVVLEIVPSLRAITNNIGHSSGPGLLISYLDQDADACIGWVEAWRFELVTSADYRSDALHG